MAHGNRHRRSRQRRGIVILMVISLLVLFMLMLVTFAVVSGHYRDAARAFAFRKSLQVKFAENNTVLDDILNMILGEPASPSSSLWGQALLTDLYGDSINGIVAGPPSLPVPPPQDEGNNTFVSFYAVRDTDPNQPFANAQFANTEDYYTGCVITMKDGPCAGQSSRITHYAPGNVDNLAYGDATDPIGLRVEGFESGFPQVGNHFVINGKPFNGTGVGRRPSGEYFNDASEPYPPDLIDLPWALMPHLSGWQSRINARDALKGGADEPWDTFDFQNMFLALVPSDPTGPQIIKPSYHDQALLQYWDRLIDMSDDSMDNDSKSLYDSAHQFLLRQIMFRPLKSDHPFFTGSNPLHTSFELPGATGNFWDVDNDKDGTPDSIWIDPGLPVATAPDGRKYKRLVAVLIRDLDGRININANGTPDFATAETFPPPGFRPQAPFPGQPGAALPDPFPANPGIEPIAGKPTSAFVPRGLGFGPAEINFLNLFQLDGEGLDVAAENYRRLFQGTSSSPAPPLPPTPGTQEAIPGKYGLDVFLAPSNVYTSLPFNRRPGIWGPNGVGPGIYSNDQLSVIKTHGFGLDYSGYVLSNYASPSDVWGRGAIALDYAGQPYPYDQASQTDWLRDTNLATIPAPPNPLSPQITAEVIDNPYEINLIDGPQSFDTPYTIAEQERLLRRFDPDSNVMPSRLYNFFNLFGNATPGGLARRINTTSTLGSSINVPRGAVPYYMRLDPTTYGLQISSTILDICGTRVAAEMAAAMPPIVESQKQFIVKQLMPFEFYHGQMFDLNRPFGNGVDDDNNGVVDEPVEGNLLDDNGNGTVDEPGEINLEPAWTYGPLAMAPAAGGAAWPLNDARNFWWDASPAPPVPYQDPNYLNYLQSDPHLYARQLYARHLYCLMMLMCDVENYITVMPNPEGLMPDVLRKLFCRRLAQYAINAVDFRDPDVIMTPFEYDEYPFDGWHVDGNLESDENDWLTGGDRGLVWGMEQQDLVLKETVSFHNRRVRDTAFDDNAGGPKDRAGMDNDVDQLRLPEGTTIIELLCTRGRLANNPKLPLELYNAPTHATAPNRLDVARMTGASPHDGAPHPVWQIAISGYMAGAATDNRPNTLITGKPDTFSLEPTLDPTATASIQASLVDTTVAIPIERYVWLTNNEPAAATGQRDNTFINSTPWDTSLEPGSYLVIGPRLSTVLGSLNDASTATLYDGPSEQAINLSDAGGVTIANIGAAQTSLTPINQIRKAVAMVAAMRPPEGNTIGGVPSTWPTAAGSRRIGLNVTEPLPQSGSYYTFPTEPDDAYDSLTAPTNKFPDEPFDSRATMPLQANNMLKTKTYERTHTMVLQRLANPLQPWHPVTNPYINLDWAENDTTVFTGDEDTDRQVMVGAAMEDVDPFDPSSTTAPRDPIKFRTRQRGNTNVSGHGDGMLWSPQTADPTATAKVPTIPSGVYFEHDLVHTLGFVNGIYKDPDPTVPVPSPAEATWPSTPGMPLVGGVASPLWNPAVAKRMGTDPDVPAEYVGDPSFPFPWITWNNRPYANPAELLNVPASSPQRIDQDYSYLYGAAPDTYDSAKAPPPPAKQGFYGHLLNFFLTTINEPGVGIHYGTDFHRVFDFVETPSPYVGTERWYPPNVANSITGTGFRAPFNRLSRFRDPGKININTVVDPLVWDAIVSTFAEMQSAVDWQGLPAANPTSLFIQLVQSRRGYATGADLNTTADMFMSNPSYPTLFANPIRPADAFDLQPLDMMKLNRPVDATLLRGNGIPLPIDSSGSPAPGPLPLFNNSAFETGDLTDTTTYPNFGRATDRNSYFRYQPFTKLSNMLTTNSNTFAIWLTVGYFEVKPNTPSATSAGGVDVAHPDGWQLEEEMLFEGSVRRPRAFFLIDRSIPVGYEPGKALNIDKCVLQRRYIE